MIWGGCLRLGANFQVHRWASLALCPSYVLLILSNLPGYGTAKFPAETYRAQFQIDKFDLFLCVTSGKLKEDDIAFFRELRKERKHCIFVRNEIDAEFQPGLSDIELQEKIAENLAQQLLEKVDVVFTSCRTGEGLGGASVCH